MDDRPLRLESTLIVGILHYAMLQMVELAHARPGIVAPFRLKTDLAISASTGSCVTVKAKI